jgi:hypothetical protein
VRASFNDAGYVLLTDKYINSKSKLKYICPKGHLGSVIWNNWLLGNRCMECSGKKRASFKKIKASFELEGYTLLSDKYINRNSTVFKFLVVNKYVRRPMFTEISLSKVSDISAICSIHI